jgi:hypothetical protein
MKPWETAQQELGLNEPAQEAVAESQKFRATLQGATYSHADEVEAFIRSLLPESLGGGEYRQIKDELTQKLTAYKKQNPGEALTYEIAGALVPSIATMFIPGMQGASLARLATIGGGESLASYIGQLDRPPGIDDLSGAAATTAIGAVGGPIAERAVGATGGLFSRMVNFAREKLGDKPADAVQAELRRLAEGTGKTVDEIVQDVIDGKIMAENRTLQAAVRALRSKGGEAGAMITEALPARRAATRAEAVSGIQEGLAPNISGNVVKAMKASDDELGKLEQQAYRGVFGSIPDVSPEIASQMQSILSRFPAARDELSSLYGERNLVPLFDFDEAGTLVLKRSPNLEDAEILKRVMDEHTRNLYKAGSGTRATNAGDAARDLKAALDAQYPDLKIVRAEASARRTARDQFAEGRKALSMNVDDLEIKFEEAQRLGDAAVRAFRAGVMDGVRNRTRRSPGIMARLADPDRQEGAALRVVFPEDSIDDIQRKLDIASGSQELYDKVLFNSMTAPEQAAASQIGSGTSITEIMQAFQGNPIAIISAVSKKLQQGMPQLSDKDRASVARVLLTEDPDMVLRALTNNQALDEMLRKAAAIANVAGSGVRTVFGQQVAAPAGGLLAQDNQ